MSTPPRTAAAKSEPRETGPLARVSTAVVAISLLYAISALAFAIYSHQRWITPALQARAYLVPLVASTVLALVLRARPSIRVATALFIVPMVLALFAADLAFARSDQVIRRWGWRLMVERKRQAVAAEIRSAGIVAYPFVTSAEFNYGEWLLKTEDKSFLPLTGVSGARTVICDEGGLVVTYASDEHGFNNPMGLWKSDSIDLALVGDSFVFGSCVAPGDHFVSLIRQSFPRTINAGGLGNGPLSELGILREYIAQARPSKVLWFFFEGNDMENLYSERRFLLARYLDPSFTQRLAERQPSIDSAIAVYADSIVRLASRGRPFSERARNLFLLRDLRIGWKGASGAEEEIDPDFVLLGQVLAEAKRTVNEWGGSMILVYLPEQHRLERDAPQPLTGIHDVDAIHAGVLEIARELGLPVLDIGVVFSRDPSPRSIWWRPRTHLSPYGNRALANALLERLR